ncbi:MAG: biotin--[acetyl-CoA-carboxylase] ligase [Pseudolabrys sp.]|nr:biotin--[acetyl-CoA-carboxylase] ligase [Pseudolabrys sp.]MSP32039.1 biotin--[acetyl-CoA-carboxylase] ligase [Pseudolabrys sp.]
MNREATDLAGVRHIAYETLGSTNAEALARARAGERGPLWVTAKSQSAGRGRRGSIWASPPGNLYATLLLSEPSAPEHAPQLSFVAALALHDAITECAPQLGPLLKVKWPNDLLLGGAKLAGILIEGESDPVFSVAIGIGVNCATHPENTAYLATDLAANGALVTPAQLLALLPAAMLRRLDQWQRGQGFAAVRADWLKRAAGLGEDIRVRLPEREIAGRFQGLDDAGRLLVEQSGGVATVTAGDVFDLGGR